VLAQQKISGFTLYELMIALAIGSVVLVLAVPSFNGVIDNQRMTSATNDLVMSLNLAKSEAIKRVVYVTVCRSSNSTDCTAGGSTWNDGWIVFANASIVNLDSLDAGDDLIRVYPNLRQGLSVTPTGGVDGFMSFRPGGTLGTAAANIAGSLTICDDRGAGFARGVNLDPSGHWIVSRYTTQDGSALSCP
jgi:type IV fimbrial biogenesis protein FimT